MFSSYDIRVRVEEEMSLSEFVMIKRHGFWAAAYSLESQLNSRKCFWNILFFNCKFNLKKIRCWKVLYHFQSENPGLAGDLNWSLIKIWFQLSMIFFYRFEMNKLFWTFNIFLAAKLFKTIPAFIWTFKRCNRSTHRERKTIIIILPLIDIYRLDHDRGIQPKRNAKSCFWSCS